MFRSDQSILLIIDVQGKLARLIHDKEAVHTNIQRLIKAAQYLDVPIVYTEQLPNKIGETIEEIKTLLPDLIPFIKSSFSCCGEKAFTEYLATQKRKQIIVCGIETHVCVCQTVADLLAQKYDVQVVVDAVSSRKLLNKEIAIKRMEDMGALLTTMEMLGTELLQTAAHPKFKEVLNLIK